MLLAAVAAVCAPWLTPNSPTEVVAAPFSPPSWKLPFGTDDTGANLLSLIIWGARASMLVGVASAVVSSLVGGVVGIVSGYFGGIVDIVLMRVTDFFIVVPQVPLMIVLAALWGPSLSHVILVIGLLLWTRTARLVRSQVIATRELAYVKRTRQLGASHFRVTVFHILPQAAPLLLSMTVISVSEGIFAEAALAFLGLSSPSEVSWGTLIQNAFDRSAISAGAWWAVTAPGLAISIVVLAAMSLSLGLEDVVNPRLGRLQFGTRKYRVVSGGAR